MDPLVLPEGVEMSAELAAAITKSTAAGSRLRGFDACFFCTQLAGLLRVAMAHSKEQVTKVRWVADLTCNAMAANDECRDVMCQIERVMDAVDKGQQPWDACHAMHFCRTPPPAVRPMQASVIATAGGDCACCEGATQLLQRAIKSAPKELEQARAAAGIVCDVMPADDLCHVDLKMFDSAMKGLYRGRSPRQVCEELGFCKRQSPGTYTPERDERLH